MRMKYIYEEYETHWWRRFTKAEYEAEKKTRLNKGVGFFKTFESDKDLGDPLHRD